MARRNQAETRGRAEDETGAGRPPENPAETAAYVAALSAELASLAAAAGLPMLAYFLNLAHVEAEINARDQDDPGSDAEP